MSTMIDNIPSEDELGLTAPLEKLVYRCFLAGGKYSLTDLRNFVLRQGSRMARETAISARVRELNARLRPRGFEIVHEYFPPKSRNTRYWLEEIAC